MSELVREALRQYERQRWWDRTNAYGATTAAAAGVGSEEDVVTAIHALRAGKRVPRTPASKK